MAPGFLCCDKNLQDEGGDLWSKCSGLFKKHYLITVFVPNPFQYLQWREMSALGLAGWPSSLGWDQQSVFLSFSLDIS